MSLFWFVPEYKLNTIDSSIRNKSKNLKYWPFTALSHQVAVCAVFYGSIRWLKLYDDYTSQGPESGILGLLSGANRSSEFMQFRYGRAK